jgi:prepilin-type processing-associated H-X9-DG protein
LSTVLLASPQGSTIRGVGYVNGSTVVFGLSFGFTFSALPGAQVLGATNYLAMAGYPYFDASGGTDPENGGRYTGMFTYNHQTRIREVSDGTSNTILFGEYSGAYVDSAYGDVLTGWTAGAWGAGSIYSFWPPVTGKNLKQPLGSEPNGANPATGNGIWYAFGSKHNGGAIFNVVFADGSVKSLQSSMDYSTFVILSGMADGVVADNSKY